MSPRWVAWRRPLYVWCERAVLKSSRRQNFRQESGKEPDNFRKAKWAFHTPLHLSCTATRIYAGRKKHLNSFVPISGVLLPPQGSWRRRLLNAVGALKAGARIILVAPVSDVAPLGRSVFRVSRPSQLPRKLHDGCIGVWNLCFCQAEARRTSGKARAEVTQSSGKGQGESEQNSSRIECSFAPTCVTVGA
jgi:hypothetical protein